MCSSDLKNVKLVLEVMGRLKSRGINYHLHVVGGYKDPAYETVITSAVQEYGVGDMVTFHGWKRQDEILALHAECAIYIHPSLQENMPMSIAESMSTGRVVLATNVGAVKEMFRDGVSGFLFPSEDREKLGDILANLYQHPDLLHRVSAEARKEALEKFHPDRIAGQTLDFFNTITASGARPMIA